MHEAVEEFWLKMVVSTSQYCEELLQTCPVKDLTQAVALLVTV